MPLKHDQEISLHQLCLFAAQSMRSKRLLLLIVMCIVYGFVSVLTAYSMLHNHSLIREARLEELMQTFDKKEDLNITDQINDTTKHIQIWDVSGMGRFLWQDVLKGVIPDSDIAGWRESSLLVDENYHLWYRLMYDATPQDSSVPVERSLILMLDAHNPSVIIRAKVWLDYVLEARSLTNIGLFILGDESCNNDWLTKYLDKIVIRFIFLIYDSSLVDNKRIFGWPLGPAREFNLEEFDKTFDVTAPRKYACSFMGTVYPMSPRKSIAKLGEHEDLKCCYFKWRNRFVKDQGFQTGEYINLLSESDLTLSPAGKNAECSRTYEAMALGSIPVLQDTAQPGGCSNITDPYKLLKEFKAPVIFLKDWKELPKIVAEFDQLSLSRKTRLRLDLIRWYSNFKLSLNKRFLNVLKTNFK